MNILQLISSAGYYGAENMVVGLAGELSRLGHNLVVGVFQDGRRSHTEVGTFAEKCGLPVRLLPCKGRWDWDTVRSIRREIADNRVDLLHAHGYKADIYSYLASRKHSPVLISTCHSWPPGARVLRLYAALDRLALRAFDQVATMSGEVAGTLLRSGLAAAKVNCIWNGVDCARFDGAEPTLRREIPNVRRSVVGMVARMVPYKGAPVLLRAARQVLAADPDVTFVFVGEGEARKDFERTAEELGIARNVFFAGVRKDMPGVYASLDVLVLPSAEEAMPMALLEGMSAGLPVIATPVGGVPELILPDKTGYLIPVRDAGALGAAILRLVRDPQLARVMGDAARRHIRSNFSLAATARKYLALYQDALAGRRSGCVATKTIPQV